jgi:colanic acid biosynthesis glycosyl transferase WcaI
MQILILSHYYPPESNAPANRMSELAKAWVKAGHQVCVVTCAPNHPDGVPTTGYTNAWTRHETLEGVEVIRIWTVLAANKGFGLRSANYLSYLASVVLHSPSLPQADVVISTSPQFFCGLAGAFVARRYGAPWLLEIRDLWPDSIVVVGAMKKGVVTRALELLERWAYRRADHIVAVSPAFVPHIRERAATTPIDVIENGGDLGLFADGDGAQFRERHGLNGKFVASYVGTHGMAHSLDTVLDAATLTRDDPSIAYVLVGGGSERARLLAKRDSLGLDNVLMLDQRPRAEIPEILSASDVSLVHLRTSPLFKTVIPSKIFEAMAMAKPILIGVDGEARRIVEDGACGLYFEPENAQALANSMVRLAGDKNLYESLARAGPPYVAAKYDRAALARRYLDIVESLA